MEVYGISAVWSSGYFIFGTRGVTQSNSHKQPGTSTAYPTDPPLFLLLYSWISSSNKCVLLDQTLRALHISCSKMQQLQKIKCAHCENTTPIVSFRSFALKHTGIKASGVRERRNKTSLLWNVIMNQTNS